MPRHLWINGTQGTHEHPGPCTTQPICSLLEWYNSRLCSMSTGTHVQPNLQCLLVRGQILDTDHFVNQEETTNKTDISITWYFIPKDKHILYYNFFSIYIYKTVDYYKRFNFFVINYFLMRFKSSEILLHFSSTFYIIFITYINKTVVVNFIISLFYHHCFV